MTTTEPTGDTHTPEEDAAVERVLDALPSDLDVYEASKVAIVVRVELRAARQAAEAERDELRLDLKDFRMVIQHCSEIYDHASHGRISKPNTLPSEVISVMEELAQKDIDDAVQAAEARVVELEGVLRQAQDYIGSPANQAVGSYDGDIAAGGEIAQMIGAALTDTTPCPHEARVAVLEEAIRPIVAVTSTAFSHSNAKLCPHGNDARYPTHARWCDECWDKLAAALTAEPTQEQKS